MQIIEGVSQALRRAGMGQTWAWPTPQDIRDRQGSVQFCQQARVVEALARCLGGVKLRPRWTIVGSLTREHADEVNASAHFLPIAVGAGGEGNEQAQMFFPEVHGVGIGIEVESALAGEMEIVQG